VATEPLEDAMMVSTTLPERITVADCSPFHGWATACNYELSLWTLRSNPRRDELEHSPGQDVAAERLDNAQLSVPSQIIPSCTSRTRPPEYPSVGNPAGGTAPVWFSSTGNSRLSK
jgi:hypothetical protein